ncbi:uncharacterized protein LOC120629021 isoform X2 [Pararge aegeria]|uniref:uncharacterized protein LOC120629021 isoform X2 n=1 Tax=Pararge aegeria TaxID=116150 RepID=UPI0019CF765D|nr:uncharacterized protein LOC120629021 isoform X2 [Pararge aegeria]
MVRAAATVAMALATLLVCCNADPHQEQDLRVGGHNTGDRYDVNDFRRREELDDIMRFLIQYENKLEDRNFGGMDRNTILGRLINYENNPLRGPTSGSSFPGHDIYGGKNINGGSPVLTRDMEDKMQYARFVDSLGGGNFVRSLDSIGGGNFVRNLDSIGGANFVKRTLDSIGGANFVKRTLDSIGGANFVKRNLDSIGGANFVKKNLDQIGGPNLVKRHLDSLGGGNLVRNLDSIGGGNFVRRQVDSLGGGNFQRNLDPLGGGNLVREVRELRRFPYFMGRRFEYNSPYGGKRDNWPLVMPIEYGYYGEGLPKRNFDEIDRSNLDNFVKKRNFDEIDQTSMPFPFKRFYHFVGPNYLDSVSSFDKKRYRPDFPMDEIDLSQFPIGSKRSSGMPVHTLR